MAVGRRHVVVGVVTRASGGGVGGGAEPADEGILSLLDPLSDGWPLGAGHHAVHELVVGAAHQGRDQRRIEVVTEHAARLHDVDPCLRAVLHLVAERVQEVEEGSLTSAQDRENGAILPKELEELDVDVAAVFEELARIGGHRVERRRHREDGRAARQECLDDGPERVVFALKVEVEGAFRHVGPARDLLDLGRRDPALGEHRFGGAEERNAGVGIGGTGHAGLVSDWRVSIGVDPTRGKGARRRLEGGNRPFLAHVWPPCDGPGLRMIARTSGPSSLSPAQSHAALSALRKTADELAARRNERTTTGHLLAALVKSESPAADLLLERRLDADVLLQAARVLTDDGEGALGRALDRAKAFAARSVSREPGPLHLLFALCQERGTASYRTLEQCGVDVSKLRASAMQLATGLVAPRRVPVLATTTAAPIAPRPSTSLASPPASSRVPVTPAARPAPPKAPIPVVRATPEALRPTPPPSVPMSAPVSAAPAPQAPATKAPGHGVHGKKTKAKRGEHARFALDPKVAPLLTSIGKNLTLAALQGELDPVIGRDEEIDRVLDVLAKREARNPCIVGVPGVGKTSVVRGLAQAIAKREGTSDLDERIIVEIEPSALVSGTGLRGALAERIAQLKAEIKATGSRVVLFFDEIHTLFADAGDEGATELKTALARGEIVCIGACTREECRRFIEGDPSLLRRFSMIEIEEPSREDAFLALEAMIPAFEKHHQAAYSKESIACAVSWSIRYVTGRALPDKAIGILDLAGARVRRRGAAEVLPEDVADVVCELASVPAERLLETDGERMLKLESLLAERVVGHRAEIGRIASVLRRNASGIRGRRPIGTFLLLGPTGVGKTETAKAIAECLFHSESAMTRLDMSEYAEPHAIARLVGAPPGYVGHESGGHLTEAVKKRPYQVILLDEIEKAHRDVLEAFLQVFDEGRLTDGRGRTVDFTNTVLVLTSNLGADKLAAASRPRGIGFSREAAPRDVTTVLQKAAREGLPPELYNRIDEVLAMGPLDKAEVAEVASRMLAQIGDTLEMTRGVRMQIGAGVTDVLLEKGGYDPELGARPMRRAIVRLVEAPLSELLLRRGLRPGDVVLLDVEEGAIVVDVVEESRATA